MSNLKELKNQIDSVRSTRKITQAMKMVAASKLRRAQETAESARPYSEKIAKIMSSLAAGMKDSEVSLDLLLGNNDNSIHIIIAVTSDRGLCGGFNSSIVKSVKNKVIDIKNKSSDFKIICLGKKGADILRGVYGDKVISAENINDKNSYTLAENISNLLVTKLDNKEYGTCSIIFNQFKSAISQIVTEQSLIPCSMEYEEESNNKDNLINFEFEPDEKEILSDLLPKNLTIQIYKAILESGAGEQGARMAAMDNATRNAGEMIDKLNLSYNRQRQAIITGELIEIISGAEAL
ncbi:MAG: F0F1 ATP synthase subunit gamma [Pelagibacterales bacterium]|nr:F0F1 ATP synthase subunit gamma [Pelagibacterales bacterium]PPR16900.1 MAG: ATP synthase gamma chain [Alphaproteobacteria bacterium MarineAlpha9_Bin3]|tara:strand:- start:8615 stop:9493 length:879 start_codon:yes stop_codon:yes gene_type:complete